MTPSPDYDPVFESLLNEALGDAAPSDQTETILARIQQRPSAEHPIADPRPPKVAPRTGRRVKMLCWSSLLAVAASLAWMVLTASQEPDVPRKEMIAEAESQNAETEEAIAIRADAESTRGSSSAPGGDGLPGASKSSPAGNARSQDAIAATEDKPTRSGNQTRRRVPMKLRDVPFETDLAATDGPSESSAMPTMPARPEKQTGREIVDRIDAQLKNAWASLSLERAETADATEVAGRFERILAVSLTPVEYTAPDRINQVVVRSESHAKFSRALVDELLGPSAASRLSPDQRSVLEARIASAFNGETGFDEVITTLYLGSEDEDTSRASQAWLTALAGSQSVPITEQTARALLDLDLRCGRCHEHPIESGIGQQDYWQFASLFANGLHYTRSEDGQTKVHLKETKSNPPEGLFYELPDGRQRVALPSVSPEWLGVPGAQSIEELSDLSTYWIDNPQLAKSTVNRLWKIVHGRPLVGSASDPGAPPRDEHLTELRDFLAEQLRAHDFDLAAATSWILAAEPMRLTVAPPMTRERIRTASTEELLQADFQTRAFAAYRAVEHRESFSSLVALATRWNGGTGIDGLTVGPTLAQPIDGGSKPSEARDPLQNPAELRQQWLRSSFPTISTVTNERPDLPAQWLTSLKSFEQQARHLYYAAGYWHPSQSQMQAAEALRDSSKDAALALSQLWWAIENGAEQVR